MTFFERYQAETTWHGRVMIIEIFHLAMSMRESDWTVGKTAESFGVSIGLVSENLKLARAIHLNEKLLTCQTRQEALKRLQYG